VREQRDDDDANFELGDNKAGVPDLPGHVSAGAVDNAAVPALPNDLRSGWMRPLR
jgi:hypothetical protein